MKKVFDENPGWRLLSKSKLVSTLKLNKIKVPRSVIDGHFKSSSLSQVFKKRPKAPSFRITAMPYSFQIDVVKTLDDAQFLLLVDIMSRKAFGYMMPSGKMVDVLEKYEVFKRDAGHHIVSVSGDAFFDKKAFKEVNAARFTSVYTSVAKDNHAAELLASSCLFVFPCLPVFQSFSLLSLSLSRRGFASWFLSVKKKICSLLM